MQPINYKAGTVWRSNESGGCLLSVIYFLRIHVVVKESVFCHLFPFRSGHAVIAVRIDRDASAGSELAPYFNVFGIHEPDQIFHDDVYTVFMEISVIAEREQIEL